MNRGYPLSSVEAGAGPTPLRLRGIAIGALLFLAFGGYIKGLPALSESPIDLTLVAGVLVLVCVVVEVLRTRAVDRRWLILATIWVVFVMGWPPEWSSYAVAKTVRLFTIILLCTLSPMVLLRERTARRDWVAAIIALGMLLSILSYVFPNLNASASGRLAIEGGNTIGAGRGIGAAVVALGCCALALSRYRVALLSAASALAVIMIGSGSRGPVMAAVIACMGVAVLAGARGRLARVGLASLAMLGAVHLAVSLDLVSVRLTSLSDESAAIRLLLWERTIEVIAENPLGIGWGQLYKFEAGKLVSESGDVQYPHNIFLEIASEAGLVACLVFTAILVTAVRHQRSRARGPVEMAMLGILIFYVVCALVSGDINDNRGVWVAIGVAFAYPVPEVGVAHAQSPAGMRGESG